MVSPPRAGHGHSFITQTIRPSLQANHKRPSRLPVCSRPRLFPAVQIDKPRPGDLGRFGGGLEIHQFFVELLGMRDITLVFFEGGRFKQFFGVLIGAAEHHYTEDAEYKSCGYHGNPFQVSLRRDTFVFARVDPDISKSIP